MARSGERPGNARSTRCARISTSATDTQRPPRRSAPHRRALDGSLAPSGALRERSGAARDAMSSIFIEISATTRSRRDRDDRPGVDYDSSRIAARGRVLDHQPARAERDDAAGVQVALTGAIRDLHGALHRDGAAAGDPATGALRSRGGAHEPARRRPGAAASRRWLRRRQACARAIAAEDATPPGNGRHWRLAFESATARHRDGRLAGRRCCLILATWWGVRVGCRSRPFARAKRTRLAGLALAVASPIGAPLHRRTIPQRRSDRSAVGLETVRQLGKSMRPAFTARSFSGSAGQRDRPRQRRIMAA